MITFRRRGVLLARQIFVSCKDFKFISISYESLHLSNNPRPFVALQSRHLFVPRSLSLRDNLCLAATRRRRRRSVLTFFQSFELRIIGNRFLGPAMFLRWAFGVRVFLLMRESSFVCRVVLFGEDCNFVEELQMLVGPESIFDFF